MEYVQLKYKPEPSFHATERIPDSVIDDQLLFPLKNILARSIIAADASVQVLLCCCFKKMLFGKAVDASVFILKTGISVKTIHTARNMAIIRLLIHSFLLQKSAQLELRMKNAGPDCCDAN